MRQQYSVGFRMSDFKQKEKGKCAYCGKSLPKYKRKYCSEECSDIVYEKFVKPTINDWNMIRKDIKERDKYTCQKCGFTSKDLEVHHIKPVKNFPELEFDKSNCITLCKECHKIYRKILPKEQTTLK